MRNRSIRRQSDVEPVTGSEGSGTTINQFTEIWVKGEPMESPENSKLKKVIKKRSAQPLRKETKKGESGLKEVASTQVIDSAQVEESSQAEEEADKNSSSDVPDADAESDTLELDQEAGDTCPQSELTEVVGRKQQNTIKEDPDKSAHNLQHRDQHSEIETSDQSEHCTKDSSQSKQLKIETAELRALHLKRMAEKQRERLKNETPGARARRLQNMSQRQKDRLQNETPKERALRLRRMAQRQQNRLTNETAEERECRLQKLAEYAQRRLQNETLKQKTGRLKRMSQLEQRRRKH